MSVEFLTNISIILTEPSHPGNIGATARAMKNMGLQNLILVAPQNFPSPEADSRASGAVDILANAQCVDTLAAAIGPAQLVLATSARLRALPLPILSPREAAGKIRAASQENYKVAIVFGRERIGLENEELDRCHYQIKIPTSENFSSLNLAQAVQIICYEILVGLQEPAPVAEILPALPSSADLEYFYQHLEQILLQTNFLDPQNPRFLMRRLRNLYRRAQPDIQELNILRGILTAIENKITISD